MYCAADVPVCLNESPIVHGVGKGEMVDVICSVSANPKAVTFEWTFNNSAEFIRVPGKRALTEKNGTTSKLTYTPKTDKDYGTLMCSATNEVGRQRNPCIFHIILAGKLNHGFGILHIPIKNIVSYKHSLINIIYLCCWKKIMFGLTDII